MVISLIALMVFLTVGILVYEFFRYRQTRLSLVVEDTDSGRKAEPAKVNIQEHILHRILKAFGFLAKFKGIHLLPARSIPTRLIMAGHPISIVEFAIFKVLSTVIFLILGRIVFQESRNILLLALSSLIGFMAPDIWLNLKMKRRRQEIRRDLPAVIDLLNLCVDAGLDFILAVNRVITDFKKCPLTDELSEVWRETKMGASRREALQQLSRRVNLPELSSFVRTLLQADRMGSPMGEALKIQSEEIRMRRFLQGEEAALKAPIKLLFPLLFFILPAVLAIVAGPLLLQFLRGGIKF